MKLQDELDSTTLLYSTLLPIAGRLLTLYIIVPIARRTHYTELTALHYTTLHYTALHYTTLHNCTLLAADMRIRR